MNAHKILVLVFLLTLPLVTTRIRGADEIEYFSHLRSLAFDSDLEFGNEYEHFYRRDPTGLAGFKSTFLDRREPATHAHINFAPMGSAILWSPFYLVAHVVVLVARALGSEVLADGFSRPYVAAACYASAFYAFLGLLLTFDTLTRRAGFPPRAAFLSVLGVWFASPLLYYMTVAPAFAHGSSFFAVSLVVALSLRAYERGRPSRGDWAVCGAAAGLCALVREQDGLVIALPLGLLALRAWKDRSFVAALGTAIAVGCAAFVVFVPQLVAYKAINGTFGPSSLVARKMSYGSPHFFEVLFDPAHGFFFWAPLAILAVWGLVTLAWKRRLAWVAVLIAALLLQVWINGAVESWTQAGAFGARRFVSTLPVLAFGLAMVFSEWLARGLRVVAALVLVFFTWWNVSLMVQFALRLMDRQGLEWPRVAVNQVTEVPPRLARTAWLFLSDRERLVEEAR